MHSFTLPFPPIAVLRAAVAGVWLYEGLWCKLLGRTPSQVKVVTAVPRFGALFGAPFLMALGVVEVGLGVWAISGVAPALCAVVQVVLLITLNINGLIWARRLIHEPLGMVFKNAAFLVLVWITGAMGGRP
jgi:uncharacterized membrane protein YphA (DoxX/SURF4 family)